tara:strand:+ start:180 stop:863 length:684 start_codon:yes stop_codon:yes gene_type:complete
LNFNFINRDKLYKTLEPNDNLKITKNEIGDLKYYSIDDFLKNPLDTISILREWPALDGHVYTPGARQNFTPMDLVPILKKYQSLFPQLGVNVDVTKSLSTSLILSKNMQVWKNSWMPHVDNLKIVCNIWLCDYVGGTAFYRYKGHYNNDNLILPKSKVGGIVMSKLKKSIIVPWQNFEGDEDWELYHIAPSTFNTLIIYEGKNFHGTYAEFDERYRYSIQSFIPFGS